MKVKCIINRNSNVEPLILPFDCNIEMCDENFVVTDLEATGSFIGYDISVGREYLVYGILEYKGKKRYLIQDDSNIPMFHSAELFKITDEKIDEIWDETVHLIENEKLIVKSYYDLMNYEGLIELIKRKPEAIKKFLKHKETYTGFSRNDFTTDTVTISDDGTTVIKVYYARDTFEWNYYLDGTSTSEKDTQTYKYGASYNTALAEITKDGYTFNGWYDVASDSGRIPNEIMPLPVDLGIIADKDLYAYWTINEYTITFHKNDGSAAQNISQIVEHQVPENLDTEVFTRNGYTFLGWNTVATGGGTDYEDGESVSLTDNLELFAQWEKEYYTITYYTYYNSPTDFEIFEVVTDVEYGEAMLDHLPTNTTTPIKASTNTLVYTFVAWASIVNPFDELSDEDIVCENVTTTAIFSEETRYYSIVFYDEEGTMKYNEQNTYNTLYSAILMGVDIFAKPEDNIGTYELRFKLRGSDPVVYLDESGVVTADAIYDAVNIVTYKEYTVRFMNEESVFDSNLKTTYHYGDVIIEPTGIPTKAPTATTEYLFTGWKNYTDGATVTGNVDYVAEYSESGRKYTITFNTAHVTNVTTPNSKSVEYGQAIGALPELTKTGYEFNGWWTTTGFGEGTDIGYEIFPTDDYELTSDLVVYLKLVAKTTEITIDANGGSANTTITATYDDDDLILDNFNIPTKKGHTLVGFYTARENGNKLINVDNDSLEILLVDGYSQLHKWLCVDETITLYAIWTVNEYTITFNTLRQEIPNPNSIVVEYGQAIGTMEESTIYGYYFNGWWTTTGFGQGSNPGERIYSTTLYEWEDDIDLYLDINAKTTTINIDANGGNENTVVVATYNSMASDKTNFVAPIRTGYTLAGFFTSETGGTRIINEEGSLLCNEVYAPAPNGKWNSILEEITIFAQWTPKTYTITYDVNGGNALDSNEQVVTFGAAYLLKTPSHPTKYFDEWKYNNQSFNVTQTWQIDDDVNLKASWSDIPEYTVSFNGGTDSTGSVDPIKKAENTVINLPENSFVKTGYSFDKWYDGTNYYSANAQYTITANIAFTATWTINQYTYRFKNYDESVLKELTVDYGTVIVAPLDPTKPKDNTYSYSFTGWSPSFVVGTTMPAENVEYIAQYNGTIIPTYTISFECNKASATGITPNNIIKKDGETIVLPNNPYSLTGYSFSKWNDGTNDYLEGETYTITADKTLRAILVINEYKVIFYDYDNTFISEERVQYNSIVTFPSGHFRANDNDNSYSFDVWVALGDSPTYSDSLYMPARDISYKASYDATPLPKVNVSFNVGEGTIGNAPAQIRKLTNSSIVLPENTTSKKGYTFAGWSDGTNEYQAGATYNVATNDITFVAEWEINSYTYTFYDEDGQTIIKQKTINYGTIIEAPANPTKEKDAKKTYEFAAWDPTFEEGMVISDENISFTAKYTSKDIPSKSNAGLIVAIVIPTVVVAAGASVFFILRKKKKIA